MDVLDRSAPGATALHVKEHADLLHDLVVEDVDVAHPASCLGSDADGVMAFKEVVSDHDLGAVIVGASFEEITLDPSRDIGGSSIAS